MKIYIIFGSTGDYDDYREWPVVAYTSLKEANHHIKDAQEYANELMKSGVNRFDTKSQYDPRFSMDYNGTFYGVDVIELKEEYNKPRVKKDTNA